MLQEFLALALALFCRPVLAALPALVQDTPYPEILSLRRPFTGIWGAPSHPIPTDWAPVSCISASSAFVSVVSDQNATSEHLLVACTEGGFFDLTANVSLEWTGPPGQGWIFSAGSAPHIGSLYASSSLDNILYDVVCAIPTCTFSAVGSLPWEPGTHVHAITTYPSGNATAVWVSGDAGTAAFLVPLASHRRAGADPLITSWLSFPGLSANATAYSDSLGLIALGNWTALTLLDSDTGALVAWDWVTDVDQGWGAPIDSPITALVYGPDGTLYIGNAVCLNLRFPNGTYARIDGPAGLPAANITSLALDTRTLVETPPRDPSLPRIWIGTLTGAILFDPSVDPADDVNAAGPALYYGAVRQQQALEAAGLARGGAPLELPHAQRWRFFLGPRYLPVNPADTLSTPVPSGGIACAGNTAAIISGSSGVGVLNAQLWTLAQKAAWMEALQPAFDREYLGITGSCGNPAWGVSTGISCGPDDNNGLWTSVLLGAFVFKAAVTRDPADIATAWHYFGGMSLLNDVTGIRGFPARSPTMPNETWPSGDPEWWASPSLPGWHFKGSTSSDETDGHAFVYPLVKQILAPINGNVSGGDAAADLLLNLVRNIVSHNFTLEDPAGVPTEWGHWEPLTVNFNRSWSDTKSLNSLEVLAYINAALDVATDPQDVSLLLAAYDTLVAAGYHVNMRSTRINAPCDINYSDDELLFLSHFTFLFSERGQTNESVHAAGDISLRQTWLSGIAATRSTLYAGLFLAMTGQTPTPLSPTSRASSHVEAGGRLGDRWDPSTLESLATIVWGLRTWPLELTDWPTQNSARLDVVPQPGVNRFGQTGDGTRVLPVNERNHGRWNADPYTWDGGSGSGQSDTGVYLLPYWLAKYYSILS